MRIYHAAFAALVLGLTFGHATLAATAESSETSILTGVTVSAAAAISSVEAQNSGKVVELTLAGTSSAPTYDVTTEMPDGTESNFVVDAKTGAVTPGVDKGGSDGQDGSSEVEDGNDDDSSEMGETSSSAV